MANLKGRATFSACAFSDQARCPIGETGRLPALHCVAPRLRQFHRRVIENED